MINEEIYDITSGARSVSERVAYRYAEVKKKHRFKFLFDPLRALTKTDFLNDYIKGVNPFPENIEIDLTNACNHDCPFCIYSSFHKKGRRETLSAGVVCNLIDQFKEIGGKSILFIGGGEPLVHKNCVEIIRYAYLKGLSIGLVTNGSVIKKDEYEILKKSCSYIRVSVDAGTSETYAQMHKKNDFEKVLENVRQLSKAEGLATIGVSYFISESNFHEISLAASLFKKHDVDYIQFKTYSGINFENSTLSDLVMAELDKSLSLSDDFFDVHIMDRIFEQNIFQVRDYSMCHWQAFKTIVNADGNVYLCAQKRGKSDSVIGNIYQQSLLNIWNSQQRKEVVKSIMLEKCPYCVHHTQNKQIDFIKNYAPVHTSFY